MPRAAHGSAVALARMAAVKRRIEFAETFVEMRIAGPFCLSESFRRCWPPGLEGGKRSLDQPLPTLHGLTIVSPCSQ